MKRSHRSVTPVILLILTALGACVAVVAALLYRDAIEVMISRNALHGTITQIPDPSFKTPPPLTVSDGDWPRWRGPGGLGHARMEGLPDDWTRGLEKEWEVDYLCAGENSAVWSSPVVQGNRLVVSGRIDSLEAVFCLHSGNGKLIWKAMYESPANPSFGTGARATPWIDNDRVYTFSRSGELSCRSLLDGTLHWMKSVSAEGGAEHTWGHSSSPLVLGELVIVNGGGTARTIAYDKISGAVRWKSGSGFPGYAALTAMPAGDRMLVLSFHGTGLTAMDAETGDERWSVPWETDSKVNASTPLVAGNRIFLTSGYGFGCGLVEAGYDSARVIWRNTAIASHHSDPVIIDGYVYGYSGYSMQNRGTFVCVDLETGEERWSSRDIGWGTCLRVNDFLLCMDIRGNLFLVDPDPGKLIVKTSFADALGTVRGAAWTLPVIAQERLYLRLRQTLICYAFEG
ncbi:PQQ-like beta-propeller repeat protein [bacterium]|nr:PQQ-like beta-propeller repeat protein [bacterium]